jgi:hypothetical protein
MRSTSRSGSLTLTIIGPLPPYTRDNDPSPHTFVREDGSTTPPASRPQVPRRHARVRVFGSGISARAPRHFGALDRAEKGQYRLAFAQVGGPDRCSLAAVEQRQLTPQHVDGLRQLGSRVSRRNLPTRVGIAVFRSGLGGKHGERKWCGFHCGGGK